MLAEEHVWRLSVAAGVCRRAGSEGSLDARQATGDCDLTGLLELAGARAGLRNAYNAIATSYPTISLIT
jgi:hypothetical protein